MLEITLPVAEMAVAWPLLVLLGVLLGLASSSLGIGAGVVSVPILFGLFGMSFEVAASSSLALLVGNAGMGVFGHARRSNVDLALGTTLGAGVSGGALIGGALLAMLSHTSGGIYFLGRDHPWTEVIGGTCMAALLLWIATLTLRKVRRTMRELKAGGEDDQEREGQDPPHWLAAFQVPPRVPLRESSLDCVSVWPVVGIGLFAGFFAGLLGVGGGFLMVPVLLYWFRSRTSIAIGTSLCGVLVGAIVGTLQKLSYGHIDLVLVGVLLVGGVVGIPLGIWVTRRVRPHELRRGYGYFCIAASALSLSRLAY